jgi:hypothetical protein
MIHRTLFLLILSSCLLMGSMAQTIDGTRRPTLIVNATAIVMDNLEMLTIRNIDLISVVRSKNIMVHSMKSPFAGLFKITGNPNARIRITFLQRETLVETKEGIGIIKAKYNLSTAFKDLQNQSTLLDIGEANLTLSDKGLLFVFVGANLDLSAALPGKYQSEFTIELEYI